MIPIIECITELRENSNTIYYDSACFDMITSTFEKDPRDYLHIAKKDYYNNDLSKNIDIISNCKRAIDCQVDSFLKYYDLINETNIRSINTVKDYLSFYEKYNHKLTNTLIKFQILSAFDIVPVGLVSNIRKLRNRVEHSYEDIDRKHVDQAIEITHLFLNASDYVFHQVCEEFSLSFNDEKMYANNRFNNGLYLKYLRGTKCFKVEAYKNGKLIGKDKIIQDNKLFLPLVHLSLSIESNIDSQIACQYLLLLTGSDNKLNDAKLEWYDFTKYKMFINSIEK